MRTATLTAVERSPGLASLVPGGTDPALDALLTAIARLAGAATATLFDHRREGRAVRHLAGDPVAAMVLGELLATPPGTAPSPAAPRWLASPEAAGGEALLVTLLERPGSATLLLLTPRAPSAAARAALARGVPDLAALLRHHLGLARQLRAAQEERDAAREALDHCEYGLVVVRADHSIVFANQAGSRQLGAATAVHVRRGLLRPVDHGKAIRFEAALDGVIAAAPCEGARARASVLLLSGADEAHATIVAIAPVGRARPDGAAAMVYLLQPAQGARRGLEALCKLHGLSRVESHLIAHLMDGLTITKAAVHMQVKAETARTYLKQIFLKAGVRRQTDLISLMTRYMSAVRGEFEFYAA